MAPPAHHEPLSALSPIEWSSLPQDDLPTFLSDTFTSAQVLIDSIPLPAPVKSAAASAHSGRARSHTDSDVAGRPSVDINHALSGSAQPAKSPSADAVAAAAKLQKEWKEVKVSPRDNPLAVNVYKLAAKDGRGSWFARRSVHEGITFEKFKLGLEREFAESLKVQEGPGAGKIRGIGADKKVEHRVVEGYGKLEVYQLSAQFPGPTTPRDFITLLLTSAGPREAKKKLPRQFMVVSKPCQHPECPQRSGYIRGHYESVEIIREIPIDKPLRRTRSSIDVSREDARPFGHRDEEVSKEAIIRSAKKVAAAVEEGRRKHKSVSVSFDALSEIPKGPEEEEEEEVATAVEWLMVTRSDPGGNVPRYLVERGTPSGIISDAGRLLDWLDSIDPEDFGDSEDNDFKKEAVAVEKIKHPEGHKPKAPTKPTGNLVADSEEQVPQAGPGGFYEMIANALGAGVSVVASHMPIIPFSNKGSESELEEEEEEGEGEGDEHLDESHLDSDDSSSIHSFASAQESVEGAAPRSSPPAAADGASMFSGKSDDTRSSLTAAQTQHEKELRKLEERRRKVHERIAKAQERSLARKSTGGLSEDGSGGGSNKEAAAAAKLREKHEKELAKQEEKYRRELRKLEQKKAAEERKAEERRRKQAERQERGNLALELEKARAERDVALKQIDVLKDQVGELQAQNTMLVARLGRAGLVAGGSDAWKEFGGGGGGVRRNGSVHRQGGEKPVAAAEEEVKT
ncbi:uncharacterized protein E0L32_008230 [Thyridium curvatum]|uniref:DUF3074 domain-containing protein n=1 Tax=Thyridium curvatum TaxID=1093900 RepID=A0A507B137_9PEZI|nr:uncharacterized protein E0L32_008230 [Thyridium curvatum]TPX10841.1 hypothetical protein E0L32_008230 [Thyridium curvatum]